MQAATAELRIGGVPEHFNMPWHLVTEVDFEWIDYAAGTGAMLADLQSGRIDSAILLTEGAALGLARDAPIAALSLYTSSPLIWGVHVDARSQIGSVAELAGTRFAISRYGSGSHLMSLALAVDNGWPLAEQSFVVVNDLPGAITALASGAATGFLWEHFTTAPVVDAGQFRRLGDFVAPWPAWVICARRDIARTRRSELESLIASVCAKASWLKHAPDAAARIAARYELRPEAVGEWLERTQWVDRFTDPANALAEATAMLQTAGAL